MDQIRTYLRLGK